MRLQFARKSGSSKGPALTKRSSDYLPKDPARQQTTGHKQDTRAERQERGATRVGKLAARGSRSGAVVILSTTSRSGCGRSRRSGSGVDVHIAASSDALKAREHLVLVDAELLREASRSSWSQSTY